LIFGIASLVVLGCGGSSGEDSSCISTVRWNQTFYYGLAMKVAHGAVLGRGTALPCTPDGEDQQVIIRRVPNVPPALAVVRGGAPGKRTVNLAPGFFPVLPDHPLHRGAVRPRRCSGRFRLTGTVLHTPTTNAIPMRVGGRELSPHVVTSTEIVGFRRAGHPYLQRRDLVDVRGRRCDVLDFHRLYVVDVVTPAD
jgi:hypothetical protein